MTALANAQPLPTGWIKKDMIVRHTVTGSLMRVMHLGESGEVDARKARSNKLDVLHLSPSMFVPATLEERVTFALDAARIGEIRRIIPSGKDERQFRIIFMDRIQTAVVEKLKPLFDKVESSENPSILITVPQSWLDELVLADPVTPAVAARAEAEAAAVVESAAEQRQAVFHKVEAAPAVVDWFMRNFTRQGVDMTDVKIAPGARVGRAMGEDPTYYLYWPTNEIFGKQSRLIHSAAKEMRLVNYFANDRKIIVDLPPGWTPTFGESPVPVGATHVSPVDPATAEPDDEALAETARLIAELRARNEQLTDANKLLLELADTRQELIDSLTADINARDLRAADAAEQAEAAEPVALQPLTACKEWDIANAVSVSELNRREREGWTAAQFAFEAGMWSVVYYRQASAPVAPDETRNEANARLIERIGPAISYHIPQPDVVEATSAALNQAQTPAINFGTDIATARATLSTMMNDPEISHEDFYRAVIASRLPREDKDAYIRQSRQFRVGGQIDRQARLVPSPFHNQPPVRIPADQLAVEVKS